VVIVELPWNHEIIGDRFDESMARYRQPELGLELARLYDEGVLSVEKP